MLLSEKDAVVENEEEEGLRDEEEMNILLSNERENETDEADEDDIEPEIEIITSDLGIQEVCCYY
jgi:hypothetical protein